jgi:hypothetical protein
MATMILSSVGSALFGPVGGFLGALAGQAIDTRIEGALTPTRRTPSRLDSLSVQTVRDGAPMARVWGKVKLAGHVIWADRFKETVSKTRVGGKAGPKVESRSYSLSFAIGLCEGPISGIGRVWANGTLLDMAGVTHRLLTGSADQEPDPLLEAVLGLNTAPGWRDMAVLVFEDLPLADFGDRIPSLQVEVFAHPQTAEPDHLPLEKATKAICLIPGSGEFAYATTPVRKVYGPGREKGENLHASPVRSDFDISLDALQRDLPAVESVSLVVAWFGDDLRCGTCTIRPKVETRNKATTPLNWSVAGLTRSTAGLVSQIEGKPAYGGSPTDDSVIEAIIALKNRNLKVVLNPFVMMDIPAGNSLPDPRGAPSQPPYPWRGRITCTPAPGLPGSPSGTAALGSQVAAFFGTVSAAHFSVSGRSVSYSGPDQWSYSRFVLHQAALAKAAGGVDAFLLGSEMVGLTGLADGAGVSPAVAALKTLAAEVRSILGASVKLGYGADWTEYGGQVPVGAPSDLWFPLDPLWADPAVDFVGIDWYPPIADTGPADPQPDYQALKAGVASGEGFDFYYVSEAARTARSPTPITDNAYNQPWVYRQKDLKGWWSNQHHPRSGGIRATTPTAWVPGSKPVWLLELGFPAVDRAANRPSVFPDPKSSESGLPPFSSGLRDDMAQRLALEATLNWWLSGEAANPVSSIYGASMVDTSRIHLWCWDARPYPWFPARTEVWADGAHAPLGHWLMGRAGASGLGRIIADLTGEAGLDYEVSGVGGMIEGYVLEGPISIRDGLEPLLGAFGIAGTPRGGAMIWASEAVPQASMTLGADATVMSDGHPVSTLTRSARDISASLTLNALSASGGLDPGATTVLAPYDDRASLVASEFSLPAVISRDQAQAIASRMLAVGGLAGDLLELAVAPAASLQLEAGDRLALPHLDGRVWVIDRMEGGLVQTLTLRPAGPAGLAPSALAAGQAPVLAEVPSTPVLHVLDLPGGIHPGEPPSPALAVFANPWPGGFDVQIAGKSVARITRPAVMGELAQALAGAPAGVTLAAPVDVLVWGGTLPAEGRAALLDGETLADIIGWTTATLTGPDQWRLGGVHRGLSGAHVPPGIAQGAVFVLLDEAITAAILPESGDGATLTWTLHGRAEQPALETALNFTPTQHRPWSPEHVLAVRSPSGIRLAWIRRGNRPDAGWGLADVPAPGTLRWRVQIKSSGGIVVRATDVTAASFDYQAAEELTDFGAAQTGLYVAIAQYGDDGLPCPAFEGLVPVKS